MSEVTEVDTRAIAERQVRWRPKGYGSSSDTVAIIRDGALGGLPVIERYHVQADPDGCIEFFQAIKRAMAETRKD